MPTLSYNGMSWTVDHAVKGADYVHGYAADGSMVIAIEHTADLDNIGYDGTYLAPGVCASEACNDVKFVDGQFITKDGRVAGTIDKLWENASPASSFGARTISLDLSKYNTVLISVCTGTNGAYVGTYIFEVGSGNKMTYGAGAYMGRRNYKVTSTGVTVEGGAKYENSWSDSDAYQKPMAIYGLKGVQ